jgi:hypothetical protein
MEQRRSREDHAGRTEAALDRTEFHKSLLKRAQLAVNSETFYRRDLLPRCIDGERQAGEDGFSVNKHGAGTAFSCAAPLFCAREKKFVPQHIEERIPVLHQDRMFFPVHYKMDQPPCRFLLFGAFHLIPLHEEPFFLFDVRAHTVLNTAYPCFNSWSNASLTGFGQQAIDP